MEVSQMIKRLNEHIAGKPIDAYEAKQIAEKLYDVVGELNQYRNLASIEEVKELIGIAML